MDDGLADVVDDDDDDAKVMAGASPNYDVSNIYHFIFNRHLSASRPSLSVSLPGRFG